ncbi:tail protein [Lelliottia phage phD2B]|uniref:Putative tail tubular protein B n=1 Tax=Lelliottia phage phD2B TaxID=1542498 RepID=A0A088FT72_9CAUD|nr:tail protein [Lelliottia phage phD2B]AIM51260.1 putative tail tubular protein B [Lelliottia phage phD2B]
MEVQGSYGRLIQGMSQQPAAVRLPGQVSYQLNTTPDVVDGVKTRPGTNFIREIAGTLPENTHFHHYRRGDDIEEYFIVTKPNTFPEVYDKSGRKCVVTLEGSPAPYTNVSNPAKNLRLMTIADFTFIVNTGTTVKVRADKSPTVGNQAIVFSAFGQYATTYKILIGGTLAASYTTLTGGNDKDVETIRTEYIIGKLHESLLTWTSIDAYTVVRDGTTIVLTKNDGTDIEITTDDGAKGKDLVAIRNKVSSTDLLPSRAPAGYKVQIWPTGSKPESRYWLEAEPKGTGGNLVSWKECLGAGLEIGFDKATMPHVLVREGIVSGVAQFKLRQGDWTDRDAGDDLTNPFPSFLDQRIGGIFMTQNRLCLTNGEAVAMARSSRFFDFFRPTVLSALSTDPIDTFSDASEVYELTDAVSLDGDTVIFSRTAQFLLPGDKALTKENAVLRPTTTFECSPNVPPVATGDAVMFAFEEGAYSGVREFFTDSTTDTKKAQPTTHHVKRLIEGRILRMESSSNFNRLFIMADKNRHRVYVYDWLWQGSEKVQSAWHIWEFPAGSIVQAMFYSSELVYIIITRPDGNTYLETMEMSDPLTGENDDQHRLDRGTAVAFKWQPAQERWVSDPLPYKPTLANVDAVIGAGGWEAYRGGSFLFDYDSVSNTLSTEFDLGDESETVSCWVGETYPVQLEPTQVIIKDSGDRTSYLDVPTVGQIWLNTDKAPTFSVDVAYVKTGRVRNVNCANRVGGSLQNIGGRVPPHEQSFRIPMRARSTDVTFRIKVQSPHTFQLRDIEWEGSYNPRRRRV